MHLFEVPLMSTQNICFYREIKNVMWISGQILQTTNRPFSQSYFPIIAERKISRNVSRSRLAVYWQCGNERHSLQPVINSRILHPWMYKSGSRFLKIPKSRVSWTQVFPRGTTTNYDLITRYFTDVRNVLFLPSVAS